MRRLLFMAALSALLVPATWAQRGGMHGASFSSHGSFGSRGAARVSAPSHFSGSRAPVRSPGSFRPPFRRPTDDHRHVYLYSNRRAYRGYGYPYFYGAYYNPFYWDWYNSSYDSSYGDDQSQQTARQIDQLGQEVAELRQEREYSQESAPSVPRFPLHAETKANNDMTTVLVFLDKHIQEVKNYAIANEMVLVFDDHRTKKIPLGDIDLAATMKLNDERGVDFEVPSPTASE